MKKVALFIVIVLLISIPTGFAQGVRKPVWQGKFYDDNPGRLSLQIEGFLKNAAFKPASQEKPLALIAPHAGYSFSGQVAALAYHQVAGRDYETVVIIGPSHRHGFEGCSIYLKGGFETPLGIAAVDEELAVALSKASGFKYISEAHQAEHSVEVQVPFIQKTLPGAKIIPIVMGLQRRKTIQTLADAMAKVLEGKNVLVIASTDMSHFLSREKANALDAKTVSRIQSGNAGSLIAEVESGENILCGGGGVAAVLLYVQKKGYCRVETLGYADSSQTGGPRDSVVGYLAAALYVSAAGQEFSLSQEEKKELLALARSAITKYVQDREVITHYPTQNQDFLTPKGAFVTLKKSHRLRGCIGFTEPLFPLYDAVIRAAVYAAVQDPRFPPLTEAELKDLEVEISVLTPPQKLISPALIQIGKHGLIIEKGDRKGLLLPQVPVENQWSEEQFLEQVCLKAGLPSDAWKFGADLYVFEAIVFE